MNISTDKTTFLKVSVLVLAASAGILSGYSLAGSQESYCENIEEEARTNTSFQGAIACFPPSRIEVEVSDELKNRTDLRCLCRRSYLGQEEIFAVRTAS